eukprot:TRINITY_DN4547_c0_g1_i1.p1 TRINITY_DN4547_c0_g1~~TRINITY_DN4547_c0_g1_i1.p1  ORF type:complete len:516 (+),score=150.33 TRINITY_DN4547_c0_g1_i1:84-1631(+)
MALAEIEAPVALLKADTEALLCYSPFCSVEDDNTTVSVAATSSLSPTTDSNSSPAENKVAAIAIKGRHESHLRDTLMTVVDTGMMENEQAFFLCDLGSVYRQHQLFVRELPMVESHYAVKCNPDPMILKALAAMGAGFDCASRAEIEAVISMGVSPTRIIYANPCKPQSHIRYAKEAKVDLMTFDSIEEMKKIAQIFPAARLVLRILADDSKSSCRLGLKFGAAVGSHTTRILKVAKKLSMAVVGVSFHVGSGCTDADTYVDAIGKAQSIFKEAEAMGMPRMTILDIGGGFPGEQTADQSVGVSFPAAAQAIRTALDQFDGLAGVTVIAEPGRYYVAGAMTLALNVIAKRVTHKVGAAVPKDATLASTLDLAAAEREEEADEDDGEESQLPDDAELAYFVSDGVYGSFNCIIFDHQTDLKLRPVRRREEGERLFSSVVWGPTCDSIDCVTARCMLPELEIGEWLYVPNMGAYTGCAASTFNGFAKADFIYTFSAEADFKPESLPDDFPLDVVSLR